MERLSNKTQIARHHPKIDSVALRWSLRICISNKFPGDADDVVQGNHTWRTTAM